MSRRVLFVTPEIAPLNKVGGLGDVSHGLVTALRREGWDARVLVPGFPEIRRACERMAPVASLMDVHGVAGCLLEVSAPALDAPLFVADFPAHFQAAGSPYGAWGADHSADARRFAALAAAAVRLAGGAVERWRPEVVHCNDWTTGLIPVLLRDLPQRPATVFTIHNLAHQGLFSHAAFEDLQLPEALWSPEALEFYGQLSFIKGGLVFADRINTVSPAYAREILTAPAGCGLEGLLQHRRDRLSGILNGVDYDCWDPAADRLLRCRFDTDDLAGKRACKAELQRSLGLPLQPDAPVAGVVSRLTEQKGIDLIGAAGERLLQRGVQLVCLGSGDPLLEATLADLAARHPGRCAVRCHYDEALAHRIIAGSDLVAAPSARTPMAWRRRRRVSSVVACRLPRMSQYSSPMPHNAASRASAPGRTLTTGVP